MSAQLKEATNLQNARDKLGISQYRHVHKTSRCTISPSEEFHGVPYPVAVVQI